MTDAFFIPEGDGFVSSPWTRGPWDLASQHGGPPSALTARAIEHLPSDAPMRVARYTFEILRPIPVAALRVEARVTRPGKRVQRCEAALLAGDEPVALAAAWRIRAAAEAVAAEVAEPTPHPAPEECEEFRFPDGVPEQSYMTGMEWRVARGSPFRGASAVWFRMRVPLVAGEDPSPLSRVLCAADSGNGISAELDFTMLFINVDLTVHLVREPVDEWVCLDARTRIDSAGIGATASDLWDRRARLGTGAQSLYVGAR